MKRVILAAVLLFMGLGNANAYIAKHIMDGLCYSPNYRGCDGQPPTRSPAREDYYFFLGYVMAMTEVYAIQQQACLPKGTTTEQLSETFVRWMGVNEKFLGFSGSETVLAFVQSTYPCKKK